MDASKIALSIIAKNEAANIANVISSVLPHVDAVYVLDTGSTDKTVEIAKSLGAIVEVNTSFTVTTTKEDEDWVKEYLGPHSYLKAGDTLFRFAAARNYAFSMIPKDFKWILWLDADDTFDGASTIKDIVRTAEEQKATSVFLNYLYQCQFNPDGSIKKVIIEHLRERIILNDGTYTWKGEIHETLVADKEFKNIDVDVARVIHHTSPEEITKSIDRNIKNLEYEVKITGAEDPRPIYYLAKAYYDVGTDALRSDAEKLIKEGYLKGSGWAEERSQAWEYIASIRKHFNDPTNVIKASHNSLIENPLFPSSYVTLAEGYILKGQWELALHWIRIAANVKQPHSTLVINQFDLAIRSLVVVYIACINLSKFDEAWSAAQKLAEMAPEREDLMAVYNEANSLRLQRDLTTHAGELIQFYGQNKMPESIQQLVASLPPVVSTNQVIQSLAMQYIPPKTHKDKDISIFCGPGFEIWNPKTIEEVGSGGSEEAVYRLSKELTKQGYRVTVYANPGEERGEHDGVMYLNHYEINWGDNFNILIAWRQLGVVDLNPKTKRFYLWLHDVPQVKDYDSERVQKLDKVIVLSQFHASLVEEREIEGRVFGVPKTKLMVSRNGVTL